MALFIGSRVKRYLSSLLLIFAESQGIGGTGNNLYLNGTSTTAEGRITRGCSRTAFAAADPPVICHILEHLGLWVQKSSRDPPSQEAPHENGDSL